MARRGLESVAILYENSPFNIGAAQGGKEWADRLGLKVSYFQSYREGKAELPRLLPEVLGTRADGLILCSYPQDSYELLALLKQAESRPKALCLTIGPALPNFYEQAGSMAEGVFGPSQWEPDTRIPFPGTREFIDGFKGLTQRPPSYHAGSTYAACQILEKAITHNRSLDQEKLREYILSLDTVTVIGRFRVDSTGMQVGHNPILIQWQHGKKEIVYPTSMQTAPPRF
jgi:branched-chain amino acid transport system substrate-binding protein